MGQQTAAIVGAGVCGLATALMLARRGFRVTVLEKRRDNHTTEARKDLERADALIRAANEAYVCDPELPPGLTEAASILKPYWGQKERNVLLDSPTLQYLATLGIEVEDMPRMRTIVIQSMEGRFSMNLSLGEREIGKLSSRVDAEQIVLQRDFVAQPTLGELERRLRHAVEHMDGCDIRFDHRVLDLVETEACVELHTAQGVVRTDLAIVADGGAASSLTRGPVTSKDVMHREHMSIAIFRVREGEALFDFDTATSFTHTSFTNESWHGVFCNGRNLTFAVQDHHPENAGHSDALRIARAWGCEAPLAEPPFKIRAEIGAARQLRSGPRTLIAGDAAMTGNPRFGLGVQFAVLWARLLERWLEGEATYESLGTQLIAERRDYEIRWLDSIDEFMASGWRFNSEAVVEYVLRCMTHAESTITQSGNHWHVQADLSFDFAPLQVSPASEDATLLRTLQTLGVVRLEINAQIAMDTHNGQPRGVARLSPEHGIRLTVGGQRWHFNRGDLSVTRGANAWQMGMQNTHAAQTTISGRAVPQEPLVVDLLEIECPDVLVDSMLALRADRLSHAVPHNSEVSARIQLAEGAALRWGPFEMRAVRSPCLSLKPLGNGSVQVRIDNGSLMLTNFTEFAERSHLSSLRFLQGFRRATRGRLDTVVDRTMALAGIAVRGAELTFLKDGSARVTFQAVVPLTVHLAAADMAQMQSGLMASAHIGDMMASAGQA